MLNEENYPAKEVNNNQPANTIYIQSRIARKLAQESASIAFARYLKTNLQKSKEMDLVAAKYRALK